MRESDTALHDDEALNFELPDAALELAGSKVGRDPPVPLRFHFAQE